MVDLKTEVFGALKVVEDVEDVFYFFPSTLTKLPCISIYEANNSQRESADDDEYLTEVNMAVDIWAETPEEVGEITVKVVEAMKSIGFVREFSRDLEDSSGNARKTIRFRRIV